MGKGSLITMRNTQMNTIKLKKEYPDVYISGVDIKIKSVIYCF